MANFRKSATFVLWSSGPPQLQVRCFCPWSRRVSAAVVVEAANNGFPLFQIHVRNGASQSVTPQPPWTLMLAPRWIEEPQVGKSFDSSWDSQPIWNPRMILIRTERFRQGFGKIWRSAIAMMSFSDPLWFSDLDRASRRGECCYPVIASYCWLLTKTSHTGLLVFEHIVRMIHPHQDYRALFTQSPLLTMIYHYQSSTSLLNQLISHQGHHHISNHAWPSLSLTSACVRIIHHHQTSSTIMTHWLLVWMELVGARGIPIPFQWGSETHDL